MDEDVGIIINIRVPNVRALNDLIRLFGRLNRTVNDVNKSGQNTRRVFGEMARSFATVSIAMNDLRFQMTALARGLTKITFGISAAGVKIAADTEEANARLAFALTKINLKYDEVIQKVDEVSLRTVLTRKDITNMVSGLAIQRVNAFDAGLKALTFTTKDGTKQAITAMEVLNDAVAFSGKTTQRIMFSVREAVSEQKIRPGKQLSEDLNLTRNDLEKWNAALKSAKTNQEAFNRLMQLMADRVGGTTSSINKTLNFILKQFADFRDKLATEIFGPSLGEISTFLREVGEDIIKLVKGDQLRSIGEAIRQVVAGFTGLARILFLVVQGITAFISDFPEVIGLLAAATTAVIVFAGALTAIIAMVAPLLAFASLFTLIAAALSFISGIGFVVAAGFLLASAAVAGLVTALTGAGVLLLADTLKAQGFMDMWERFKLVVSAVSEGIRNMSGAMTHLSLESATALDERGLLGLVKTILMWWARVRLGFDAFREVMRAFGPRFKEAFAPAIEASRRLAESIGIDINEGVLDNMSEWEQAGVRVANTLGGAFEGLIETLTKLVDLTENFVSLFDIDVARKRALREDPEIQKRIREGDIPVPSNILGEIFEPGTLAGNLGLEFKRAEQLTSEERALGSTRESLRTFRQAERERKEALSPALRRANRFATALGEGGDRSGIAAPLVGGRVDVQSVLGQLNEVQEQRIGAQLLRFQQAAGLPTKLSRAAEQDLAVKRMGKIVGLEVAKALVKAPLTITVDEKAISATTRAIEGDVEFQLGAAN
jgi:hypothetical protein